MTTSLTSAGTDYSDILTSATAAPVLPALYSRLVVMSADGCTTLGSGPLGAIGAPTVTSDSIGVYATTGSDTSIYWSDASTTSVIYYTVDSTTNGNYFVLPPTKAQALRNRIRSQLQNAALSRYLQTVKEGDPEDRARELLREMVDQRDFRRYVTRGFLTVRGKTGLVYKIAHGMPIKCYAPGPNGKYKQFESLCVIFKQPGLPPTDQVIMQKLLVQHDEFGLRAIANVSRMCSEQEVVLGDLAQAAIKKAADNKKANSAQDMAEPAGEAMFITEGQGNYITNLPWMPGPEPGLAVARQEEAACAS